MVRCAFCRYRLRLFVHSNFHFRVSGDKISFEPLAVSTYTWNRRRTGDNMVIFGLCCAKIKTSENIISVFYLSTNVLLHFNNFCI